MINQLMAPMPIIFADDDILANVNRFHVQPLHLTIFMKGYEIKRVLVDNGASLNICPMKTMKQIGKSPDDFEPCQLTIIAYDGTKRHTEGIFPLTLKIDPTIQVIKFFVLDIKPSFNMLLSRPWLHENLVVASTLHQCLNFQPKIALQRFVPTPLLFLILTHIMES
ncbi:hypothetical protein AMTRI_Chr07g28000 [Amborella trichopoda]